jgi:hypothetical protein
MENQGQAAEARKPERARRGFFIHLLVYVLVNAGLIAINLTTSTDHLWFKWPLIGWGIGVVVHAVAVFVFRTRSPGRERRT